VKSIGVIPARLGSTRLSEKVLRLIQGRPLIQHVWQRAKQSKKLSDVIVACDDVRIQKCIEDFGGKAFISQQDHPNGTSRVAEMAAQSDADVVINIQGDEPLIQPGAIDQLVDEFEKNKFVEVATLAVRRSDRECYEDPNVVKVVCDADGNSIYFSRAPIPHFRNPETGTFSYLKHLGIYGYRKPFLMHFVSWEPGFLEQKEQLEQLRILERGFKIRVVETPYDSIGVDTEADLKLVETKLKEFARKTGVS